jgi:hypothetical protein
MALQSSGAISLNDVNVELGNSGTDTIAIAEQAVRDLLGISSGAISMNNCYGASNVGIEFGSETTYNNSIADDHAYLTADPSNANRYLLCTYSGGSFTLRVVTVSGTTATFGSEYTMDSSDGFYFNSIAFDSSNSNYAVMAYMSGAGSYSCSAVVISMSGSTVTSVGSRVTFDSTYLCRFPHISENPGSAGSFLVTYVRGSSYPAYATIISRSGTSINTNSVYSLGVTEYKGGRSNVFVSSNKALYFGGTSSSMKGIALSISGSSISIGSQYSFPDSANDHDISPDPNVSGKFIIGYTDDGASRYSRALTGTISGTAVTFNSSVVIKSTVGAHISVSYSPTFSDRAVAVYQSTDNGTLKGRATLIDTSSSTVSVLAEGLYHNAYVGYMNYGVMGSSGSGGKGLIIFRDGDDGNKGKGLVVTHT